MYLMPTWHLQIFHGGKKQDKRINRTIVDGPHSSSSSNSSHSLPPNSASSYIYIMSWTINFPSTHPAKPKLKKKQPRLCLPTSPHIQLVGRHFKSYQKYFRLWSFLYLHLQCHCSGPFCFQRGWCSNFSSSSSLSSQLQPSYPNINIIMSFLLESCNDYQLCSQKCSNVSKQSSYTPLTAPTLTCTHFPENAILKPQCFASAFSTPPGKLFQSFLFLPFSSNSSVPA